MPPVRKRTGGKQVGAKKVYVHSENRAEQLVKTASNKRNTYIYRFYSKETVGGKTREYIEEIELISGDGDDKSAAGDKSAILAKAYLSSDSEPAAVEMMDGIASTWPEFWQEIYKRILKNGEIIVSLARERGITEGAVRKTLNKIRKAPREKDELRKFVRFFD